LKHFQTGRMIFSGNGSVLSLAAKRHSRVVALLYTSDAEVLRYCTGCDFVYHTVPEMSGQYLNWMLLRRGFPQAHILRNLLASGAPQALFEDRIRRDTFGYDA
jgi:hypothetical protein